MMKKELSIVWAAALLALLAACGDPEPTAPVPAPPAAIGADDLLIAGFHTNVTEGGRLQYSINAKHAQYSTTGNIVKLRDIYVEIHSVSGDSATSGSSSLRATTGTYYLTTDTYHVDIPGAAGDRQRGAKDIDLFGAAKNKVLWARENGSFVETTHIYCNSSSKTFSSSQPSALRWTDPKTGKDYKISTDGGFWADNSSKDDKDFRLEGVYSVKGQLGADKTKTADHPTTAAVPLPKPAAHRPISPNAP